MLKTLSDHLVIELQIKKFLQLSTYLLCILTDNSEVNGCIITAYPSDLEIASAANKISIDKVAATIDITDEDLIKFGDDKAKISSSLIEKLKKNEDGKLILVTAISPTPAGEGKTTTSVGLVDGLCHIGKKAMICLREPSLGP